MYAKELGSRERYWLAALNEYAGVGISLILAHVAFGSVMRLSTALQARWAGVSGSTLA